MLKMLQYLPSAGQRHFQFLQPACHTVPSGVLTPCNYSSLASNSHALHMTDVAVNQDRKLEIDTSWLFMYMIDP